jgi:2-polyprenyl-3-methyl-5-hydroxy-6-metoxy-1,4-benzoquinol methylase
MGENLNMIDLNDHELPIKDFIEYGKQVFGVTAEQVNHEVNTSWSNACSTWNKYVKEGLLPDDLQAHYASLEYLYLIFYGFRRGWKRMHYQAILSFQKHIQAKQILEFGGGCGQLCLMLHFNNPCQVTYLDLPNTEAGKFAVWRFLKYNTPVILHFAEIEKTNLLKNKYDYVVSDAVLEHVVNLQQTIIEIYDSMVEGGFFYLLFDTAKHPSHIHNTFEPQMKNAGFRHFKGAVWQK